METIEALRLIKRALPACTTLLGISNVSFGLPIRAREIVNSVFLFLCTRAGLDLAIDQQDALGAGLACSHGGGQTRHAWHDTARTLAENGWYAMPYYYRGHGDSDEGQDGQGPPADPGGPIDPNQPPAH